ncbi:alpha/beta hydrolase [Winogradskyella aurantiaca]|uniref:alpha/beta hydrolase n=1 Tax=Winogradskyella aurantiaca TaxID=2219558 RepID=UPI000E1DA393|nr:alpha/beta hydrolase-fold protein [Winogradskyella aurantiaca]
MKTFIAVVCALLLFNQSYSQALYETFDSGKLEDSRQLKIQVPRNYNPEDKREYPLVLVLDGDYLFEPVAGNVDYQAYWEDIPDCIVVGISQASSRSQDFFYDNETFFPAHEGADFFEFITMELIPYLEGSYNISDFRIIIGHDLSANYINYYLFKNPPLFRAFVLISPDFAPEMESRLLQRLSGLQQETFYYMSSAENDVKRLKTTIEEFQPKIDTISNSKFHYKYDFFEEANHYSLVGRSIPKALNQIFELYKPISSAEYNDKILPYEGTPYEYLEKKYEDIEYFYGFEKQLIENDVRAIASACIKKDDLESLEKLAKLVKKEFPESMLSAYYSGMVQEKYGNLKRALQRYQSGLLLAPSQFIDKEVLLEKMYEIQDELKR